MDNLKSSLSYQDVEVIKKTTVYNGYYKIDHYRFRFRLFDGGWSEIIEREVFERGQSVALLPYDPIAEKVILIEQFRIGAIKAIEEKQSPWLLELVAGAVDKDEEIKQVAIREAKEEANLTIKNLFLIGDYWPSPGACTEKIFLFCGLVDANTVVTDGIFGLKEEAENIKVMCVKIEDAFAALAQGKIKNGHALIALQWLKLNHLDVKNKLLLKK